MKVQKMMRGACRILRSKIIPHRKVQNAFTTHNPT